VYLVHFFNKKAKANKFNVEECRGLTKKAKTAESVDQNKSTYSVDKKLLSKLICNNEELFLTGLQEAAKKVDFGSHEGIDAIREAIRIKSGKLNVSFYQPSNITGSVSAYLNRIDNAESKILSLAKRHALLEDPESSGSAIAALMNSEMSTDSWRDLIMAIFRQAGADEGYNFQLLFHELRCSAKYFENSGLNT
jgi:hypothetical protein